MKKNKFITKIRENLQTEIKASELDNEGLEEQIIEFDSLSSQVRKIEVELKALKKKKGELAKVLTPVLEELNKTEVTMIEVDDIILQIKRKGYDRTSAAYKDAFVWLKERVNAKMIKIVDEALEKTKKTASVASSIETKSLKEVNIFQRLTKYWNSFVSKLKSLNSSLSDSVSEFKLSLSEGKKHVNEEYTPNVAAGSVYSIEVKQLKNQKVTLTQDNGQQVVVHPEDMGELIKKLRKYAL